MHQTNDATTQKQNREARLMREALRRLEEKADRNTGGTLLARHHVHKSGKQYDRKKFRNWRMDS